MRLTERCRVWEYTVEKAVKYCQLAWTMDGPHNALRYHQHVLLSGSCQSSSVEHNAVSFAVFDGQLYALYASVERTFINALACI